MFLQILNWSKNGVMALEIRKISLSTWNKQRFLKTLFFRIVYNFFVRFTADSLKGIKVTFKKTYLQMS